MAGEDPRTYGALPFHPYTILLVVLGSILLDLVISVVWGGSTGSDITNPTPALPGSSLNHIRLFFTRRHDFLKSGFRVVGQPTFRFNLLWHEVIAVSGEEGRKMVFGTKGLDLHEGFRVLSGAIPILPGVTANLQARTVSLIHKRLSEVQSYDRLTRLIPEVVEDTRRIMMSWGRKGLFDPWDGLHQVVFQTTVRALASVDIADDEQVVARLRRLYERLDRGNTAAAILLPGFPSPSWIRNTWATKQIYDIIMASIIKRSSEHDVQEDTLQMLLDTGTEFEVIAGFMMGLLVAGSRSTSTAVSWLLVLLDSHESWKAQVISEIDQLLVRHGARLPSSTPLSTRLAAPPLDAWETETPILDSVIAETLRLAQPHVAMRRNLGNDLHVGKYVIPKGAYVVYPLSDVHLNPEIYCNPNKFDPTRRVHTGAGMTYVGWGAGKNVCAGQRMARLELKVIAAMFLKGFTYFVVDENDNKAEPTPNWNDVLSCRPLQPIKLSYCRDESVPSL